MPSVGAGAAKARASGKAKRSSAQKAESGNGIVDVSDDGSEEPSTTSNGAHSGACRLPCLHTSLPFSLRGLQQQACVPPCMDGVLLPPFSRNGCMGLGQQARPCSQEMTCLSDRLDVEKLTGGAPKDPLQPHDAIRNM